MLKIIQRQRAALEAGVSLLEVLMAISLLGISFVTIFSGLSAALRTTDHLNLFDRANEFATHKLNELFLDPSLVAGEVRSGVSASGILWEARTELVNTRPLAGPKNAAQLLRVFLVVSWRTRSGRQSLNLETLKLRTPKPTASP